MKIYLSGKRKIDGGEVYLEPPPKKKTHTVLEKCL